MEREAAEALVELSEELNAAAILQGFRTDPVNPEQLEELNAYLDGTVPDIYRLPECQGLFDTMFSMTSGFAGGSIKGGNAQQTRQLLEPKIIMDDGMAIETLAFLGQLGVHKDALQHAMDSQILVAAKVAAATTGTAATLMGFQDLIGFWAVCSTTISRTGPPPDSILLFVQECFGISQAALLSNMLLLSLGIAVSLYVYLHRDRISAPIDFLEMIALDGARGAKFVKDVLVGFGNYVVNTKDAFAYIFSETYANWAALISVACASVLDVYSKGTAALGKAIQESMQAANEEKTRAVLEEFKDTLANAKIKWTIEDAKHLEREVVARETRERRLAEAREKYTLATTSIDRFAFNFFPRVGVEIANLFGRAYEKVVDTIGPPSMRSTRYTDAYKARLRRFAEINRDTIRELQRLRMEVARKDARISALEAQNAAAIQVKDDELITAIDAAFNVMHGEEKNRSRSRSRSPPRRGAGAGPSREGPRSRFA